MGINHSGYLMCVVPSRCHWNSTGYILEKQFPCYNGNLIIRPEGPAIACASLALVKAHLAWYLQLIYYFYSMVLLTNCNNEILVQLVRHQRLCETPG